MAFQPGLIIDRDYLNAEEMQNISAEWNIVGFQWGPGSFVGRRQLVQTRNLQVACSGHSTGFLARGHVPRGTIALALPLAASAPVYFRGYPLEPGELAALRHGEEVEISTLDRSELVVIAVSEALLQQQFQAVLGLSVDDCRVHERLQVGSAGQLPQVIRQLRRGIAQGMSLGREHSDRLNRHLENSLLASLISNVGRPKTQAPPPQRWHQAGMAEAYLHAHADLPIALADLCEAVGVNERTLFLGFKERYGISPKAYLKRLRLNLAHRDLQSGENNLSVTDVAMNRCFFHLGQFATDYRLMFGELPSETLRKSTGRKPSVVLPQRLPDVGADYFPGNY